MTGRIDLHWPPDDDHQKQGNRVLSEEDFEQVVFIPAGVEPFALDADFEGVLLFQQIVSDLP